MRVTRYGHISRMANVTGGSEAGASGCSPQCTDNDRKGSQWLEGDCGDGGDG
jgi:hypothetical protein